MADMDNLAFDHVPLNVFSTFPGPNYSGNLVVDYGTPRSVTGSIQLSVPPITGFPNVSTINFTHFTIVRVPATATSTAVFEITGTATVFGQTVTLEIGYATKTPTLVNSFLSVDGKVVATGYNGHVTTMPVCFVTGTRIATSHGDVAVEDLAVGDLVVTASGTLRAIRWIGHRVTDCGRDAQIAPVRIAAHAFGADLPARDLFLSPGHPVLVGADEDGEGGHLVPIMCLVNGTTIERTSVDTVTYWHVELDSHDIILAEGLPAESYLDWGDRVFFTENADHALTNPDFVVPGLSARCRPVAVDGPVVEAERRRLDSVFAMRLDAACEWPTAERPAAW